MLSALSRRRLAKSEAKRPNRPATHVNLSDTIRRTKWDARWDGSGMARALNKLSARSVASAKVKGRYSDGGGLYLRVDDTGKRWVIRYTIRGLQREMGAGSASDVSLARAREIAADIRAKVAAGADPISERSVPLPSVLKAPPTFAEIASVFMADRESTWRSAVHRRQWRQTLEMQAGPLWRLPVADVDTDAILAVLRPMWTTKAETARRLRGRIERVLDAARAAGHRTGENPARWRGHLDAILPRAAKLTRGHHAAMPYSVLPAFMASLRERPAASARALELVILTAARSGEVRGMTRGEVDLAGATWTIPALRMKGKREHRVPLSAAAIAILTGHIKPEMRADTVLFPNERGRAHSDMVFTMLLRRMKRDEFTTHGFRSSFRDWAAEETDHPREVIEAALAHLVGDETERAYRRGDALGKRRALMDHWAAFLSS